jgi:hypothetical protein
MSLEDKRESLIKITDLFNKFVENMSEVRENIEAQSTYSEGYAACLSEMLDSLKDGGKETEITKVIKSKIIMNAKAEFLDDVSLSLTKIKDAYNDILKEE